MNRLTIDVRLAAAALLAAIAALVVLWLSAPPATIEVLMTPEPVAAGTRIGAMDIETRAVLDATGLVPIADLDQWTDRSLGIDLAAGHLVPAAALRAPGTGAESDVIGLELEAAAALLGVLQPGDRVDVYSIAPEVTILGEAVPVIEVSVGGGGLGNGRVGVLLAVDGLLAVDLMAGAAAGSIHLVRNGG